MSGNVMYVADLTELRDVTGMADGQAVQMVDTGRAGLFRWAPSDLSAECAADPMMGIYVPPAGQDGSLGAWVRVIQEGALPVEAWGVQTGTDTDQSALMQAGADYCRVAGITMTGAGEYRIDNNVSLRSVNLDFSSAFIHCFNDAMLIVGGRSSTTSNPEQKLNRVMRNGGATSTPTVRFMGSKNQFFSLTGRCDYMQLYADTDVGTDTSIAYCTFDLGFIERLELDTNPEPTGSTVQWINENSFRLQRCRNFRVAGAYQHNHNRVYGGTFEGSLASIDFEVGNSNHMFDMRFEGGEVAITFAEGTRKNTIEQSWESSRSSPGAAVILVDNGIDNTVADIFFRYHHGTMLEAASNADPVFNTAVSPPYNRSTTLQSIVGTSSVASLVDSGFVKIEKNDVIRWACYDNNGDTVGAHINYRKRVEFYDSNLMPVDVTTDFITATGGALGNIFGNSFTDTANTAGGTSYINQAAIDAGAIFVKALWRSTFPADLSRSKAVRMEIVLLSSDASLNGYGASSRTANLTPVATGIPTQSAVPSGFQAIKEDGSERYICTFSLSIGTASANAANDNTLTFESGAGTGQTQDSDIVGVNLDDGTTHWSTIASGGGTTMITITDPLPSSAASGNRVVFNRWITGTV